jgi:hypothetical protein
MSRFSSIFLMASSAFFVAIILCLGSVSVSVPVQAQSTFDCATNTQEPSVPTYEIGLDGTSLSLNVTFNRNDTSTGNFGYDRVEVVFGGNSSCDFIVDFGETNPPSYSVPPNTFWTRESNSDADCNTVYNFLAPINWVLGYCGYTQDNDREPGRTHFLNTIKIKTIQTRDDLRTPYNATREFPFTSDISIATNTTATVTGLQVFGTAYTLDLLGDLKVTVTDNFASGGETTPYLYTVSGTVVTSVQWPYRLENSEDSAHPHFNKQDFTAVADTYCDGEADNNTACTQEWDFSFNIETSVACVKDTGITSLTDEWIWMKFIVNCSAQFTGECAPDFEVDPAMNLTLTSSDFCPKQSEISLETDTDTYAFQPVGEDNTAIPNGVSEEWLTETTSASIGGDPFAQTILSAYVEETIYTYESTLYGEARVRVADGAATLATTNITQIRTVPSNDQLYVTRIVYDADVSGTIESSKADSTVKVANTGFGVVSSGYENSRVRFQFQLNNNTFDRNNDAEVSADAAEGGKIEIDMIVTFAEGANSIDDDWSSAVLLQQFVIDNNGKSVPIRTNPVEPVGLFVGSSGSMTSSSNFALGSNIGAPTLTGAEAGSASNVLAVGVVAVGGVALVAMVAILVMRRPVVSRPATEDVALTQLPVSSSFATAPDLTFMATLPEEESVHVPEPSHADASVSSLVATAQAYSDVENTV